MDRTSLEDMVKVKYRERIGLKANVDSDDKSGFIISTFDLHIAHHGH